MSRRGVLGCSGLGAGGEAALAGVGTRLRLAAQRMSKRALGERKPVKRIPG